MAQVKAFIYMRNNGDGSNSPVFCRSLEHAEALASQDNERNCEDVEEYTFNIKEGVLQSVYGWQEVEED